MKRIQNKQNLQSGFTLIELLVVIGILAILLAITLVAINPAKQFAQANNTKRQADVNAILNAIDQYAADHNGALPPNLSSIAAGTTAEIANPESGTVADICSELVPVYLAALPADPTDNISTGGQISSACPGGYDTDYQVVVGVGSANRVTVSASQAQAINGVTPVISVTR